MSQCFAPGYSEAKLEEIKEAVASLAKKIEEKIVP